MSSVYIVRNKTTLVQWVAESGKRSWGAPAHAKNAFAYSGEWQAKDPLLLPLLEERGYIYRYKGWAGGYHQTYTSLKFKEQDVYEMGVGYDFAETVAKKLKPQIKNLKIQLTL